MCQVIPLWVEYFLVHYSQLCLNSHPVCIDSLLLGAAVFLISFPLPKNHSFAEIEQLIHFGRLIIIVFRINFNPLEKSGSLTPFHSPKFLTQNQPVSVSSIICSIFCICKFPFFSCLPGNRLFLGKAPRFRKFYFHKYTNNGAYWSYLLYLCLF